MTIQGCGQSRMFKEGIGNEKPLTKLESDVISQ
jgi:hypothetical protein